MEKKVKVKKIIEVFNIMKDAKYSKMSDADKVNAWKIFKVIKPIGREFEDDIKDLRQNFCPYENFMQDVQRAVRYENSKTNSVAEYSDMTDDEYKSFLPKFQKFNNDINNAIKEYENKEVVLNMEPLSTDAFDKLRLSNDWTFVQADIVEEFIC